MTAIIVWRDLPPAVVAQLRHLQLELLDGGVAQDRPLQQELLLRAPLWLGLELGS